MDPRILQMIMALVSGRDGQQGQWQNPGFGNMGQMNPSFPGQGGGQMARLPEFNSQYQGGGYGRHPGFSPNGMPNDGYQGQMGGQNPLQQIIDYRNGMMTKPRQPQMGGAPGNPFRVR